MLEARFVETQKARSPQVAASHALRQGAFYPRPFGVDCFEGVGPLGLPRLRAHLIHLLVPHAQGAWTCRDDKLGTAGARSTVAMSEADINDGMPITLDAWPPDLTETSLRSHRLLVFPINHKISDPISRARTGLPATIRA